MRLCLTLLLLLAGCSRSAPPGALQVHAAASLAPALPELLRDFERRTGIAAVAQLDGSGRLARRIEQGAPADLILAADPAWIDYLVTRGMVAGAPVAFAGGELVLAAHRDGPSIERLEQIERCARIAVAAEGVPLGRYARQALRASGLHERVERRLLPARNARDTLRLVATGQAPAGIVYASDAQTEPRVRVVHRFAAGSHAPIVYVGARLAGGRPEAQRLLQFLAGPDGAALLARHGFRAPPPAARRAPEPPPAPRVGSPMVLSGKVALASLGLCLVPGVLLGWLLARVAFRGKLLLVALLYLPLVLPPVVTGLGLLWLLGPRGPLGGLGLAFGFWGAALAAGVVGFPLLVHAVRLSVEAVDPRYEALARSLGHSRAGAFARVTLPLAWPGVLAGALLLVIRSLGEFGATIVLAGSIEGRTRTISLAVYDLLERPGGERAAFLLSALSALLALIALGIHEWLLRRQRALLAP